MDGHERDFSHNENDDAAPGWRRPEKLRPTIAHDAHRRWGSTDSDALALDPSTLAQRLGIALQTAREWRRLRRVPPMWLRAVRALVLGELGVIDEAWNGWRLDRGLLRSPDGGDYVFKPADVTSLPLTRLRLAESQRLVQQLQEPARPPDPLTRQLNWITRGCDDNRYLTEDDSADERAGLQEQRRLSENAQRNEQQARLQRWVRNR